MELDISNLFQEVIPPMPNNLSQRDREFWLANCYVKSWMSDPNNRACLAMAKDEYVEADRFLVRNRTRKPSRYFQIDVTLTTKFPAWLRTLMQNDNRAYYKEFMKWIDEYHPYLRLDNG